LSGRGHLAQDEERPIGLDFDRHVRLANEPLAQALRDRARELGGGEAAGGNRANERHGDLAGGVDDVGVGEALLPEHHDSHPVTGIERVGLR
jgi:hypothetical protein